jgi:hypothetical protein
MQVCFQGSWETHKGFHKSVRDALSSALAAEKMYLRYVRSPAVFWANIIRYVYAMSCRIPKGFEGYSFTGKLRPAAVSPQLKITEADIRKPDYAESGASLSERLIRGSNVIPVHTAEQIELARKAGAIGREILDMAAAALKVGVTPDDIDKLVYKACLERKVYPSPLNYMGFPKSVCVYVFMLICCGVFLLMITNVRLY